MLTNHKPSRMASKEVRAAALIGSMGNLILSGQQFGCAPHKSGRALRVLRKRICSRFFALFVLFAVCLSGCTTIEQRHEQRFQKASANMDSVITNSLK
jgi:hypothetical protein